jgi:hypothetical protein
VHSLPLAKRSPQLNLIIRKTNSPPAAQPSNQLPSRGSTRPRRAIKPSKIHGAVLTMSARAPANDRCFDAIASINVMPNAVAPSAQEWNDIRADTILAKDFKGQIRGWHAFMTEGIDALFSCCHRAFDYLSADAQSARTSK